jgi:RHS repeat-associated protein
VPATSEISSRATKSTAIPATDNWLRSIRIRPTSLVFHGDQEDKLAMKPSGSASYYRARYYDSNTGRFATEDPLKFFGGDINLYRYVWNHSTSLRDPRGLLGFGGSFGGSFFGGIGSDQGTGISFSNSYGGVVFPSGPGGYKQPVFFNSYGGAAGGTRPSSGMCGNNGNNETEGFNFGVGPAVVVTNGNNANDLAGPFFNTAIAIGPVTVDFGFGNNGVVVVSFSWGLGFGLGSANYTSNTWTYPAPSGGNTDCGCQH